MARIGAAASAEADSLAADTEAVAAGVVIAAAEAVAAAAVDKLHPAGIRRYWRAEPPEPAPAEAVAW